MSIFLLSFVICSRFVLRVCGEDSWRGEAFARVHGEACVNIAGRTEPSCACNNAFRKRKVCKSMCAMTWEGPEVKLDATNNSGQYQNLWSPCKKDYAYARAAALTLIKVCLNF